MSPKPGDRGFVPLPPKIPTPEEQAREPKSGRQSRQSREEEIIDIEPGSSRRHRSPRPYHHHSTSDPFREQEEVLDSRSRPVPDEERFEIVRPHEPVRSRQRQNDVRRSKEYREMRDIAEANFKAAQDAKERYSTVEAHLQLAKEQLEAKQLKEARSNERLDRLERELEEARQELRRARQELDMCRRERRLDGLERHYDTIQDQLPTRPRGDAGRGGSRGGQRPLVHQSDMTPRTITRVPADDVDQAEAYIRQAQQDAKRSGRA